VTPTDFGDCFDRFRHIAFRLETRQVYTIPSEQERIQAFRTGLPLPERSPRTSPWLARIQATTQVGKRWRRVRLVAEPMTGYTRYQLAGYQESAAAGEDIRICRLAAHRELAAVTRDFWLFDDQVVVLLHYDAVGRFTGAEPARDPATISQCLAERDMALSHSMPLASFLALVTA
jgi:Family of unknown function (DUF6879)